MAVSLVTASAGNPRKGLFFGCSSEKAKRIKKVILWSVWKLVDCTTVSLTENVKIQVYEEKLFLLEMRKWTRMQVYSMLQIMYLLTTKTLARHQHRNKTMSKKICCLKLSKVYIKEFQTFIYTKYNTPQSVQIYQMFCSKTHPWSG